MNLKKYAATLVVGSFLLTGCSSSKDVKNDDGKSVVASLQEGENSKEITADDLFSDITATISGKTSVFDGVLQKLMDEKFPIDDAMGTDADQTIEQIEAYYESTYGDTYEESLNSALASSGFASMNEYREAMIRAYQRYNFLLDYVENNFDAVYDDYYTVESPREASIISVTVADVETLTDEEQAKIDEIAALIQTSKDFGEIAKEYSDDTNTNTNSGKLGVVDSTLQLADTYGDDVYNEIMALSQDQTSGAIKGESAYYFVKVTNTDKESIKTIIKDGLSIDTPLIAYDSYMQYLVYQSYEVKYEDENIEKMINEVVTNALAERETSRGGNS